MIGKSNNKSKPVALIFSLIFILNIPSFSSASVDPLSPDYSGRKGVVIYVSKLVNNSDGSSWEKAYHSIQAALSAIPDDKGGHVVIVRPDRYIEANLSTAYKGAPGSYSLLVGDPEAW